jgi:predicted acylesterase/phospholipase RssA
VLGAGGTLGAAWAIGALGAIQERAGRPLADVDVIVGTSAGSILAASLRYGMTPETLVPPAPLADAVVASCSIPGWHAPKRIGERNYVDGGVRSVASADILCARLRASGTTVVALLPGREDLAAIGANLMDGRRRQQVLETSLTTSPRRLYQRLSVPAR